MSIDDLIRSDIINIKNADWNIRKGSVVPSTSSVALSNGAVELEMDLSRFDAAPLIAFTATKETNYGIETDGRIPPGCGAYGAEQWADAQAGG